MFGKREGFRCGHCGRTFNRSYLHHNNLWCPNCKFFVCNECVPTEHYCPRCKEGIGFGTNSLFSLFLWMAIFFAITQLGLIIADLLFTNHQDVTMVIIMGLVIAGVFFLAAIVVYVKINKHYKIHEDYLLRLPTGEIPVEKRSVISRRRYVPKKDSSIEHKYPTPKDLNLSGNWNEIALSKDEWRQRCREEGNMFLAIFILSFIGVLFLVVIPLYYSGGIVCGEGLFLILFCIGSAIAWMDEMRKGIKDTPRYVKISLKTAGIQRIHDLISAFLAQRSIEYSCITIKPGRRYYYLLSEGIVIKMFYNENRSAYPQQNQKRLEIHYDSTNHERAREIQIGMDKYFTQKDIIYRKV